MGSAAPDLTEFISLSSPKRPDCTLAAVLPALSAPERAQVQAALDASVGTITNAAISQWLALRGHKVKWQTVATHRRAACTCD